MKNSMRLGLAAVAVPGLLVAGCGGSSTSSSSSSATSGGSSTAASSAASSSSGGGASSASAVPAKKGQPDVNGDGKVVIGIMSPGDTHDHGYYESFVDEANAFAKSNGWQVITIDKINPADAVNQARNLCRQHVDLIAIGASEIKDALTAAPEPECAGIDWYISGGSGVPQTKYFTQIIDDVNESSYVSGYAAGLLLKDEGGTKAGFVTGPQLDFDTQYAKGFLLGIKKVVPNATMVTTYTGDFDDSAKAKEAAQAQLSQGVKIIYPYLGGATDAVTALANQANVPALTPGTNRCGDTSGPKYAISVIFSPGDYFAYALKLFKDGTLKMGTARTLHMGRDAVPTIKICNPKGNEQQMVDQLEHQIGTGQVKPDQLVAGK